MGNKTFADEMKWKDEYKEALQSIYKLCIKWENQQIIKKRGKDLQKKSDKKKKQNKTKRQIPQVRIAILTGTAFAVQCSTHWAAGNLPWLESKF